MPTVVKTLKALWEYREAIRMREGNAERVENAQGRLLSLINRLEGKPDAQPAGESPKLKLDNARVIKQDGAFLLFGMNGFLPTI